MSVSFQPHLHKLQWCFTGCTKYCVLLDYLGFVSCLSLESFKYMFCGYRLMLSFQGADSSLKGGSSFPELWAKEGASQRF